MQFWSVKGYIPYSKASEIQKNLVEKRIADEIPDTVLFLEHTPVITQGRGLQWMGYSRERHFPIPKILPVGVDFETSERGGDLTYHGPGQLVIYPIVKLDGKSFGPKQDVEKYIRKLEGVFIRLLENLSLIAGRKEKATGVWVDNKKVASVGIAVRRWVTYHGLAMNVMNDLTPFSSFSPCGFSSQVMAKLTDYKINKSLNKSNWRETLEYLIAEIFIKESQFTLSNSSQVKDLFLSKSCEQL